MGHTISIIRNLPAPLYEFCVQTSVCIFLRKDRIFQQFEGGENILLMFVISQNGNTKFQVRSICSWVHSIVLGILWNRHSNLTWRSENKESYCSGHTVWVDNAECDTCKCEACFGDRLYLYCDKTYWPLIWFRRTIFARFTSRAKSIVVGSGWIYSQNRIRSHESAQKSLFCDIRIVFWHHLTEISVSEEFREDLAMLLKDNYSSHITTDAICFVTD
jgi:hypothetical protein